MNKQNTIDGGCHCGNIRYTFYTLLSPQQLAYRACGCSFCRKQGAVYTSDPQARLEINHSGETRVYQFAGREVEFVSCLNCGVMTHVMCASETQRYAVLNANTFDTIPADRKISKNDFSAEAPEEARQRRYQNWIGDVTIR